MALSVGDAWINKSPGCGPMLLLMLLTYSPRQTRHTIDSTAAQMGIVFPKQLIELYQRLDGAESGSVLPSPDEYDQMAFTPMPLEEVLAAWTGQKNLLRLVSLATPLPLIGSRNPERLVGSGWIPFATNGGGDYLCV